VYTEYIPDHLRREVTADNEKMTMEVVEYKQNMQIKDIEQSYTERFMTYSSYAASAKDR
jgi:hypothetical protein